MNRTNIKNWLIGNVLCVVLVVLDQVTKYLAVIHLKNNAPIPIIKNILELNYLENRGAAFGIMQGKKTILVIGTIIIILCILYTYSRIPNEKNFLALRFITFFLIAGAIGNLLDRIRLDYVIDFIYFKPINFPIFNVADIYVSCSAVLLGILVIFYYKDEDFEQIFPSKNKP